MPDYGFMPGAGMGGSRIPMASYGSDANSKLHAASVAAMRAQGGAGGGYNTLVRMGATPGGTLAHTKTGVGGQVYGVVPAGRRGAYGMLGSSADPRAAIRQAGMSNLPEQPMSQADREGLAASYGPQNAALAGYMAG